ncbi:lipopolysaccharide biosynthesis protein [Pelagicoccus mobilis]|uniref:Lipopolysaccharide biosynthesis protein n=1 Tax=Pelagicoccus mobilis TaxID=415221 RepID=A0A934RZE3_9BACT|nr:lipopolysaccharide biosynthesis protein [Pelagicoccus mobilis]MBK1876639.1 lipopolysaccharide biosynthesis protein [Pelagicoccus mobilis]
MSTLSKSATAGVFWSFVDSAGTRAARFVLNVLLARLLLPEQFGLIGAVTIFVSTATMLAESGVGSALVQKQNPRAEEIRALFFVNLLFGVALSLLLCLCSPLVASLYQAPELREMTPWMAFVVFLSSVSFVPAALMERELSFRPLAVASLLAVLLSGGLGLALAFCGYGVWALVWQQVAGTGIRTLMVVALCPDRGRFLRGEVRLKAVKGYMRYSGHMLFAGGLNSIFENAYGLVVGRLFGLDSLGLYFRAKAMYELPSQVLSRVAIRVMFPLHSRLQDDVEALRESVGGALRSLCFVSFPMTIGLIVVAEPLVVLLLTEKWGGMVIFLQLFCLAGALYPFHLVNLNVLKALGRSDLFLRIEIAKKVLSALALSITWMFGIEAIIWGQISVSVLSLFVNAHYAKTLLGYSLSVQFAETLPSGLVSLIMGLSLVLLKGQLDIDHVITVPVLVAAGGTIYIGLAAALRLKAFVELLSSCR